MTTRGCACGCDDPEHELEPPSIASNGIQGVAAPRLLIQPRTIAPLLMSSYGCARAPDYLYIGTVYHPDFFVPGYPYEDREVKVLGPGGMHRAPVSETYPVFNIALQLPSYVADDAGSPASYGVLPDDNGWKPGEAVYDPDGQGDSHYIACVREVRYYKFSTLASPARRYIKMWDWYEYQG